MTRDRVSLIGAANCVHSRLQILRQLVVYERTPIEVIRIRKNGREARRLDLIPSFEAAIPRGVQRLKTLIFHHQPLAEAGFRIRAKAELRVRQIGKFRPVDDVGFAPNVPPI